MDTANTRSPQLQDEVQRLRQRNAELERAVGEYQRRIAALERSATRFRLVVEQFPLSIQIFAPDGRTIQVNHAWEQLWGVTLDQIPDYNVLQDAQLAANGLMPAIQRAFGGEATALPPMLYDPDETLPQRTQHAQPRRWVQAFIYPLTDQTGRLREVVLIHEDITERRLAEEALRASEARYRTLVEHFPNGAVFLFDHALHYLVAGGRGLAAAGLTPEMVTGKRLWELFPPEIAARDERILRAALQGEATRVEVAYGDQTFVVQTLPVTDTSDTIIGGMVMTQDITEGKRVEAALRQSEAEYRAMFEMAGAGTVEVDVQTARFRRVNRRFAEFTGYSAEELLGMTVLEITHPEERLRDHAVVQQMACGARDASAWEKRYVRKDGVVVWAEVTAAVLRDAAGRPQHSIGVVHDITVRKQLEDAAAALLVQEQAARAAAQEAVRVRDAFLALAAHELKTPLTTMLGNGELLQRRMARAGTFSARDQRAVATINRQASRLNRLIGELLDLSRLDTGQLEIAAVLVDLRGLVERVVAQAQPAGEQHVLRLDLPDEPLLVMGDELRLEQVLDNLLGNAIKYSPDGGAITVRGEQRGGEVWISVTDQGLGIAAAELPQLFGRFYRASNAQAISGNGIGLYVVNEIVRLHGGHVAVESSSGQGSTFRICLPSGRPASDGGRAVR